VLVGLNDTAGSGQVGMKDQERFLAMYEEHGRLVRGFLLAATGCPHQADDLQQNVARVLLEKFADYDETRPFRCWALGIARLEVLKWRQRLARRREVLSGEAIEILQAAAEDEADAFAERREQLPACMAALPDQSRRLLSLRYERGLPAKEIAGNVGRTAAAVDMALSRIRRLLRDCITRKINGGGP
jgi:RNA polymerase sigma-70 factor (ECF subfamily)